MAKQKEKELVFNLRVIDINVTQFSQFELKKEFKKDNFPLVEFQSNFKYRVVENEEKIVCSISVKIKLLETNEYFAEIIVDTSFLVTPLESVVTKIEGENIHDINKVVLYNITAISASTVRGILSERFKGSVIQKDIYPLINLVDLFS